MSCFTRQAGTARQSWDWTSLRPRSGITKYDEPSFGVAQHAQKQPDSIRSSGTFRRTSAGLVTQHTYYSLVLISLPFHFRGSSRVRQPSSCVPPKPWQILGPFWSFRQPAASIQQPAVTHTFYARHPDTLTPHSAPETTAGLHGLPAVPGSSSHLTRALTVGDALFSSQLYSLVVCTASKTAKTTC